MNDRVFDYFVRSLKQITSKDRFRFKVRPCGIFGGQIGTAAGFPPRTYYLYTCTPYSFTGHPQVTCGTTMW